MKTRKIVRPADVTQKEAAAQLAEGGMELVRLTLIDSGGHKVASADAVGRTDLSWEATVKVAEFPFDKDGPKDEGSDEEPMGDDPVGDEDPLADLDLGDDMDEDGDDDKSVDTDILDLVKEIARHLDIPIPGEEDPESEEDGLDLPDVGAPEPGEEMDAPMPMPAPVEKTAPGAGGGVFASHIVVANSDAMKGRRSFVAVVADAQVMNDGEIVNEARIAFPGYRVAGRIDRRTLASQNEARVPMVADNKVD